MGTAREFFESVAAAAEEERRTERALQRMKALEGPGSSPSYGTTSGGHSDPMRATDSRIEFEERMHARIAADRILVDEAKAVIYGTRKDAGGGIASLLGSATADALYWRYCCGSGWHEVSYCVGRSESWCRTHVAVAFDLIDSIGMGAVKAGDGGADW